MSDPNIKFDNAVEFLRGIIRRDVGAGFRGVDDIAQSAVETAADEGVDPAALEPIADRFLRETLAAHYQAQADWPDQTDCDRLDEAFADLDARGIVCRQNFSCCGNCGTSEIGAEMAEAEDTGATVRGYTFFHMQDTESAVEGYGLHLNYGAADPGEDATVAVGREIREVLTGHGLAVDWNGSWQTRIKVTLDWKRRRPLVAGFECRTPPRPGGR